MTTPVGAQGLNGLESVVPVSSDETLLAEAICALLQDDESWRKDSRSQTDYMEGRFSMAAMEQVLRLVGAGVDAGAGAGAGAVA